MCIIGAKLSNTPNTLRHLHKQIREETKERAEVNILSLPDLLRIFSSGHFFWIRGETVRRKCMTYFAQVIANLEKALEEKQKLEVNILY